MHVLILPNTFPISDADFTGVFYKEQVLSIAKSSKIDKIGVISPYIKEFKKAIHPKNLLRFGKSFSYEIDRVPVLRKQGGNLLPVKRFWLKRHFTAYAITLYKTYVKNYGKPDVLHCHNAQWAGIAGSEISKKFDIPFIITEHSSGILTGKYSEKERKDIANSYYKAKLVISVGQNLKEAINSIADVKVKVIPNQVDTSFFSLGKHQEKHQIFTVSALVKNKGIHTLLRAFSDVKKVLPNLNLVIGGNGSEEVFLKDLAEKLKINKSVKFVGKLKRAEVLNYMQESSLYVSSSFYETFGMVIIEALSCGLPVVSTRTGVAAEIINTKNGWLCNSNSVESLKNAILKVFDATVFYNHKQIREAIKVKFDTQIVTQKIVEVYYDVVEET